MTSSERLASQRHRSSRPSTGWKGYWTLASMSRSRFLTMSAVLRKRSKLTSGSPFGATPGISDGFCELYVRS